MNFNQGNNTKTKMTKKISDEVLYKILLYTIVLKQRGAEISGFVNTDPTKCKEFRKNYMWDFLAKRKFQLLR